MTDIPVLICIDVEPDGYFIDRHRQEPWRGYESSVPFFQTFRARAEALSGQDAHFTWFLRMDPQVEESYGAADWVVRHYPTYASALIDAGDELGGHVHAYRWEATSRRWIIDQGNQPWIDHAVEMCTTAFAQALGRPCQSLRFGDRWMSNQTVGLLERLGVRYDLTLEPGHEEESTYHPGELSTGSIPDYSHVPRSPYRPSAMDYRVPDGDRKSGLVMIPVSTAPVKPRLLRGVYYRLFQRHRHIDMWTALISHEPVLFRRIVDHVLRQSSTPYLALPVRSTALFVPNIARRVAANLDMLLNHPLAKRFKWTTPDEAMRLLAR